MASRDNQSQEIIGAAMRYVKNGDRTALESYSLSALKKADYQLNDRDIDSGYRRAIKDLIIELSENYAEANQEGISSQEILTEPQQTRVEYIKRRFSNHPVLAPIIILGIIVISIGSFTDALDKILKFFEPQVDTQNAIQYQSFKLGQEYFKPYFYFTQATVGPEEKIRGVEIESLEQFKHVQGLADYMNLKLDLISVAKKSKKGIEGAKSLFENKPWETISDRMETIHGSDASASFRLGFNVPWLIFNSSISIDKAGEYKTDDHKTFRIVYNHFTELINADMNKLGINYTLDWDGRDYKKINASAEKAWIKVKDKLNQRE